MNYTANYPLKSDGICESLLFIEETLKKFRVKQRDLLEALLISEETMMLLCEHAPENANIEITLTRQLGVPRIKLTAPGTPMALDEHLGTVSIDQLGEETENAIRSIIRLGKEFRYEEKYSQACFRKENTCGSYGI